MDWKVKITASAKQDISKIRHWYAKESIWALQNFVRELTAALDSLTKDVQENRLVHDNYRKLTLKKFPYAIYYQRKDEEETIEINAVFHTHRSNDFIQKRLSGE